MTAPAQYQNFINGQFHRSKQTFEVVNPANGAVAGLGHEADSAQVDQAVTAARQALSGPWGMMTPAQRHDLMRKATELILARADEFIKAEMSVSGHPISALTQIEIPRGAQQLAAFADIAAQEFPAECFDTPMPDGRTASNVTQRGPKGVIAAICPWNLPLIMATWKLAPALAWGNTVILKPSEHTPASATLLGEIFNDAGFPPGVVNIVQGFGPNSAGEFLCNHAQIDAISFTGATVTGKRIMADAALGLRDVSLELGGKNPGLILDDCDMDAAIAGTVQSAFFNCGQVCLGTERLYVSESIFDEFAHRLCAAAQSMTIGDPSEPSTQLGPLVSLEHQKKVLQCYSQAVAEGANVLCGGGVPEMPDALRGGAWVQPTIWTGLKEDSQTIKEEIFGPCCHITPVKDDGQAVELANNSRYGLAATVWSANAQRAQSLASQLKSGVVWINGWMIRDLRTAFGGYGQSGIGREGGIHAMEFHTEIKNICRVNN